MKQDEHMTMWHILICAGLIAVLMAGFGLLAWQLAALIHHLTGA